MRKLWTDDLPLKLKLRLHKSAVCSIMLYGAEAWKLDEQTRRRLNGANVAMVTHITGKTRHEEASADTRTFDIVAWVRARRLSWLGQIICLEDEMDRQGVMRERLLKTAVRDICNAP